MYELLKKYKGPQTLREMSLDELNDLAAEIRQFLIHSVSKTGGHLAPNLGVVELTIALHNVFDFTSDRLVFDVGHQSYVHKILTGRAGGFKNLRKYEGLSGFPKTGESRYDHFNTGHASTSISAALGMARARDIKQADHKVLCVIGDGAFNGGMVWEALNDVGFRKTPLIIVLNDNEMSISRNVGSMSLYLSQLRSDVHYERFKRKFQDKVDKLPMGKPLNDAARWMKDSVKAMVMESAGLVFENMGLKYLGPVDGHNIKEMSKILKAARDYDGPVIVHAITQKGRGYDFAVQHPDKFHGIAPFDCANGEISGSSGANYSKVFGNTLVGMAKTNPNITAITAAMPLGTGLNEFAQLYPDRFFDVGITEEHAVTLAAGMAISGLKPYVAIYSTFLQRCLDQIIHDVALQDLPVTFCLDRAGVVGEDGETHQGEFDISFLCMIPHMTVMAPKSMCELDAMLRWSQTFDGPLAIRYPRGGDDKAVTLKALEDFTPGKWEILTAESAISTNDIILIGTGKMTARTYLAAELLKESGLSVGVVHAPFLKPLDQKLIADASSARLIVTVEDGIIRGGFGEAVLKELAELNYQGKTLLLGFDDTFIEQGDSNIIYEKYGLTAQKIADRVKATDKGVQHGKT